MARENIKIDDKELDKELVEKTNNPLYFTNRVLKAGFNNNLDSHIIKNINSKLTITPKYLEIEKIHNNNILSEMSHIHARLINQYNFKYQTVLWARFDKQGEDNQILDEIEFYKNLSINRNLTESVIDNIFITTQLEHEIQNRESKGSVWRFDEINSMTIYFHKTTELSGSLFWKIR